MRSLVRVALVAALAPVAAACDDPAGPPRLTETEVVGIYEVCALTFDATANFLRDIDIRSTAFELQNQLVSRPRFYIDPGRVFEFEYTPKGNTADVELTGTYSLGVDVVRLRFGMTPTSLLLPQEVELQLTEEAGALTTTGAATYTVSRDDYATLAGLTQAERNQLAERIEGRLVARLVPAPDDCS